MDTVPVESSVPGKVKRRSGPKSRTSPYTGVTQYRRTGRWEAHIWVPNQKAKGFQRHLGSYHTAEDAARCYDRAAIRFRGPSAELNFPREQYAPERDDFMRAHIKAERFRFLDLMRERFAIPSEKNVRPRHPQRGEAEGSAEQDTLPSAAAGQAPKQTQQPQGTASRAACNDLLISPAAASMLHDPRPPTSPGQGSHRPAREPSPFLPLLLPSDANAGASHWDESIASALGVVHTGVLSPPRLELHEQLHCSEPGHSLLLGSPNWLTGHEAMPLPDGWGPLSPLG